MPEPCPVREAIKLRHLSTLPWEFCYAEHLCCLCGKDKVPQIKYWGPGPAHRCAVANKVQSLGGRWLSINGRVLHAAKVAASETYNTALLATIQRQPRFPRHTPASGSPAPVCVDVAGRPPNSHQPVQRLEERNRLHLVHSGKVPRSRDRRGGRNCFPRCDHEPAQAHRLVRL
jgi:hypothetical protein